MSTNLTTEKIKELRGLCEAVKPIDENQWKIDNGIVYILKHSGWRKGIETLENRITINFPASEDAQDVAKFVKAAIETVPDLLNEIERLREDITILEGCIEAEVYDLDT